MDANPRHFPPHNPPVPHGPFAPYQIPQPWQNGHPQMSSYPAPPTQPLAYAGAGGYPREEFLENERINKRPRVDDIGMGGLTQIPPHFRNNQMRFSSEDERRLNLVRDHGAHAALPLPRADFQYATEAQRRIGDDWRHNAAMNNYDQPRIGSGSAPLFPPHGAYAVSGAYNSCRTDEFFRGREEIPKGPSHNDAPYTPPGAAFQPSSSHISLAGTAAQGSHENYRVHAYESSLTFPHKHPQCLTENRQHSNPIMHRNPQMDIAQHESSPNEHGGYLSSSSAEIAKQAQSFDARSPMPPLPTQPYPGDVRRQSLPHMQTTSSSMACTPAAVHLSDPPSTQAFPVKPSAQVFGYKNPPGHALPQFPAEGQFSHHLSPKSYPESSSTFPRKRPAQEMSKVVDAAHIFKQPHRASRPDHIVVILRGLPGSGKSYLAKFLRDLEVESGGKAPRIHSMDDYFMIEVEKVEEVEGSKYSSNSVKGKNKIIKKVMEYCYEPEMEEAYRTSMLKSFKKTLEEGTFTFVIVDDRNLRVADFAQFWATAKMSGYEVYLLEATYKDPVGCAARNLHGFTSDDIQKMADQWEQAPSMYLRLDVQSLFRGDDLNEQSIQEVDMDMDMDDEICDEQHTSESSCKKDVETADPPTIDKPNGLSRAEESWNGEGDEPLEEVKELGRSKWSKDIDGDIEKDAGSGERSNALSGLIQTYKKGVKSAHWGDEVGKRGFSIGAAKNSNISLIIGPGAGYNLSSNPLPDEEKVNLIETKKKDEPRKRSSFLEQLRAERESFKAVFDRRRQRIGGFDAEDD
ncbi:hypothetical protein H6P81_004773 [Aristolochia fimbriata]|uniref:YLP motif-containing protein 1 n=1 Tax=Aristolochia fimbriata TaxID=158543 RepID=A0AAV7EU11_ARIFI|nr:hypothetical protein H6P81_004773 [Aristolochia fimbriata]